MKLLLSAYACEPGLGSEPGVGWNWALQAARFADIWVLTRESNRERIEAELPNIDVRDKLHFEYMDLPRWTRFWKKGERGVHAYYMMWQTAAGQRAVNLHKKIGFDAVQHVTFVNSWMPSYMWRLGIPFIWGPIGTHPFIPTAFTPMWTRREKAENIMRRTLGWTAPRIRPDLIATAEKANRIICGSEYVRNLMPTRFQKKAIVTWQNGVLQSEVLPKRRAPAAADKKRPLRIITVGRLVYFKGFDLALRAMAASKLGGNAELRIVGDGPWRKRLERLSADLKISQSTQFLGKIPRHQVLEEMSAADVFLFPTFEGAGMVVMEAMSAGLPAVCLDFGGPGEYVTAHSGIKVALTTPGAVVDGLGNALAQLAHDRDLCHTLSLGATQRATDHFLWDHHGDVLKSLLDELVG